MGFCTRKKINEFREKFPHIFKYLTSRNDSDFDFNKIIYKENIENFFLYKEIQSAILKILLKIPSREKEILYLRFGLKGDHELTLSEIGEIFNITRERVRQLEVKAIKRIQNLKDYSELQGYLNFIQKENVNIYNLDFPEIYPEIYL